MPCGEFTGNTRPKQIAYCMSIVTPKGLSPSALWLITIEITIGIIAEDRAVAEAKPKWITIRNAAITAIKMNTLAVSRENAFTNT